MPKAVYRKYENKIVQVTQYTWTYTHVGYTSWNGGYANANFDTATGEIKTSNYYSAGSWYPGETAWDSGGTQKLEVSNISSNKAKMNGNVYNVKKVPQQVDADARGDYLADVILDLGSVPENGRHTDGYWYEYLRPACEVRTRTDGIWRDAPEGYVNAGGIFRPVTEAKMNVNGIWKG